MAVKLQENQYHGRICYAVVYASVVSLVSYGDKAMAYSWLRQKMISELLRLRKQHISRQLCP